MPCAADRDEYPRRRPDDCRRGQPLGALEAPGVPVLPQAPRGDLDTRGNDPSNRPHVVPVRVVHWPFDCTAVRSAARWGSPSLITSRARARPRILSLCAGRWRRRCLRDDVLRSARRGCVPASREDDRWSQTRSRSAMIVRERTTVISRFASARPPSRLITPSRRSIDDATARSRIRSFASFRHAR